MDARFGRLAATAADQHNVLTREDFENVGISRQLRAKWIAAGAIERIGIHTFGIAGSPHAWEQELVAGTLDLGPEACVAGRSAAALLGLDGFRRESLEFLVPRSLRGRATIGRVASTTRAITATDVCRVDGIRCLRAERLILDSPLFDFTRGEIENAIDSALRLRLISEERLTTRVRAELQTSVNGSRAVVDALVDAGGHSRLERKFLALVRRAALPRPRLQVIYRSGTRVVARVDAEFPGDLIVEVAGHATHSSRRQRQVDEQRRTELTLRGKRVLTFTYEDVTERPNWVTARIREALSGRVA